MRLLLGAAADWQPFPASGAWLAGVAATSATNAWAVGITGAVQSLIVHWDGTTWKQVRVGARAMSILRAVAATSARDAWAVGQACARILIVHWNGQEWK